MSGPVLAAPSAEVVRTSAKGADPLVRCFADTQDRAAAAWSFVPKESGGGTFSNAGAANVRAPYYIDVADRGTKRVIKVEAAAIDPGSRARLLAAIDSCI